jgi:guanylate kinase
LIVVVSGPGGVGKGTLVTRFLERNPQFWLSRSWTTRARRPGEPADAYVFVTPEEFQARVEANGFLEWAPFLDYFQGTPVPDTTAGEDVLLEIDTQGARQIKALRDDAVLVFVDAPSRDEQRRRLEGRGDPPDRIEQRIDLAVTELERARELGMHVVVNDDLDQAVEDLEALVRAARKP